MFNLTRGRQGSDAGHVVKEAERLQAVCREAAGATTRQADGWMGGWPMDGLCTIPQREGSAFEKVA